MEVTIEQAHESMLGLLVGDALPDMRQALFNAALSKRVPLSCNLAYAKALRKWRGRYLPDPDTLDETLRRASRSTGALAYGLMRSHLVTLYHIERAWDDGLLDTSFGYTLDSQRAWRRRIAEVWGVGYKVASWALTIYDPTNCLLMPIDTIHCDRLGIEQRYLRKTESGFALYEAAEDLMIDECSMEPEYPTSTVAAWLWFNHRGVPVVSHAGLSCRIGV